MSDLLRSKKWNPLAVNLEILDSIVRFAYANGYHELGYNIVSEVRAQVSTPAGDPATLELVADKVGDLLYDKCGWRPSGDAQWQRLKVALPELAELLRPAVETGAESVSLDYQLPCDVRLPPSATIGKGCTLRTLMHALRFREKEPVEFVDDRTMAVRRALTELHRPQAGVTVSNEHEHATYAESPEKSAETKTPRCWFGGDTYGHCELEDGHDGPHKITPPFKPHKACKTHDECRKAGFCADSWLCSAEKSSREQPCAECDYYRSTGLGECKSCGASLVHCPTCKTALAFDGDVCGLCFPVAQP